MSNLAPAPQFPERVPNEFQMKQAESIPGNQGPVRFEEGLASDVDVPRQFTTGVAQGYVSPPGRPNHNTPVFLKPAQETMQERAHAGSASWVEAPSALQEFVNGSFVDYDTPRFDETVRDGSRQQRGNPATVRD